MAAILPRILNHRLAEGAQLIGAREGLGTGPGRRQRWQQDRHEQREDGENHQNLHQGKTTLYTHPVSYFICGET